MKITNVHDEQIHDIKLNIEGIEFDAKVWFHLIPPDYENIQINCVFLAISETHNTEITGFVTNNEEFKQIILEKLK